MKPWTLFWFISVSLITKECLSTFQMLAKRLYNECKNMGTSLVVQWLRVYASTVGNTDLSPG